MASTFPSWFQWPLPMQPSPQTQPRSTWPPSSLWRPLSLSTRRPGMTGSGTPTGMRCWRRWSPQSCLCVQWLKPLRCRAWRLPRSCSAPHCMLVRVVPCAWPLWAPLTGPHCPADIRHQAKRLKAKFAAPVPAPAAAPLPSVGPPPALPAAPPVERQTPAVISTPAGESSLDTAHCVLLIPPFTRASGKHTQGSASTTQLSAAAAPAHDPAQAKHACCGDAAPLGAHSCSPPQAPQDSSHPLP